MGQLSSPSLYASRSLLGLYRSPLDALLTGTALMAQAVLLLRLVQQAPSRTAWPV